MTENRNISDQETYFSAHQGMEIDELKNGYLPWRIECGAWRPLGQNEETHPSFIQERDGKQWIPVRLPGEFITVMEPSSELYLSEK
jgi:hypothetical protein